MNSIYTAIALFSITALGGLYLLTLVLRKKETPKALSFVHGLLAVIGLVMAIVYCVNHPPGPLTGTVLFVIAALGGVILIYQDLTGKKIPGWLGILHGLIALTGLFFLLLFAFQ